MNPQLFLDLAASEEASGYPGNARALRAVPEVIAALQTMIDNCASLNYAFYVTGKTPAIKAAMTTACGRDALNAARAALAAMDATDKEITL